MSIVRRGQIIIMLLVSFSIASCSTYPNKFKCGDARGLGCTMLHDVDKQIDSGQIEEAYTKCRGKTCPSQGTNDILHLKKQDRAVTYREEREENSDDDYNLHF